MNGPTRITFTGVDPSCGITEIFSLLSADHRVELGFLYSLSKEGTGRYPPLTWIEETVRQIESGFSGGRVALHVCGRARADLLDGGNLAFSLWPFRRIQLNGAFRGDQVGDLRRFMGEGDAYKYITQFDSNPTLHDQIRRPSHQVLFDSSGGRGILREEWPKALPDHVCGYAGGLGPDTLRDELPRIAAVAGPRYWVDMEGALRDEFDKFSVTKAHRALEAIHAVEDSPASGGADGG